MIYGNNISTADVAIKSPDVRLIKVNKTGNPNYLFLDLLINPGNQPGSFRILFTKNNKTVADYNYELKARIQGSSLRQGFNSSDVIYLLMPDRFANGDTANDNMPGMKEPVHRSDPNGRHGGDIKGILQHLDYIRDLGATAIWINPLLENNRKKYSYHG